MVAPCTFVCQIRGTREHTFRGRYRKGAASKLPPTPIYSQYCGPRVLVRIGCARIGCASIFCCGAPNTSKYTVSLSPTHTRRKRRQVNNQGKHRSRISVVPRLRNWRSTARKDYRACKPSREHAGAHIQQGITQQHRRGREMLFCSSLLPSRAQAGAQIQQRKERQSSTNEAEKNSLANTYL